jgi:hypothetical protein
MNRYEIRREGDGSSSAEVTWIVCDEEIVAVDVVLGENISGGDSPVSRSVAKTYHTCQTVQNF